MQSNQKYTTAEQIMQRLAMEPALRDKDFNIDEVVQWCAECTIEVIGSPVAMYNYQKVALKVRENLALLPCNVYRLLDVFSNGDRRYSNYQNDGVHLIFSSNFVPVDIDKDGDRVIFINYRGIAVDNKTGYPLILKGHEIACISYCKWKLYELDYMNNRIDQNRWNYIVMQKQDQCQAANNGIRHETNDDMRRMLTVTWNMIPKLTDLPMYHLDQVK